MWDATSNRECCACVVLESSSPAHSAAQSRGGEHSDVKREECDPQVTPDDNTDAILSLLYIDSSHMYCKM